MIRLLHFADLHLGVENYSRTDPATGLSTCFGEFLAVLDELTEFALASGIDLVVFCGDAYKSRDPSQTQQREFARRIARLAQAGIPVFLLVGNHDLPNATGRATAVEIFDTLAIGNVTVAGRPGLHVIQTKSGPVQVAALPWLRRSALLAREDTRNLTLDELDARLAEILTNVLLANVRDVDRDVPAVLAAHVRSSNAERGSERGMMVGHDPVVLHSTLADPAFDYVALGHMHRAQVVSQNPLAAYAGSLQRIDFGEEKDPKGFYVVEIDRSGSGARARAEFHPVKARRFLTISAAVSADDLDPTAAVLKAIDKRRAETAGAIVRLQVAIPEREEGLLREADIYRALPEAGWVTLIKDVEREQRSRLAGFSIEKQAPLEALQTYLKVRGISGERSKTLLEYGERLIRSIEPEPRT